MAHSVSPEAEATDLAAVMRMHWDVEFARFFNFPISIAPSGLRPLPQSRIRSIKGTWIPASSPAILLIHKTNHESAYILSVTVPALASTVVQKFALRFSSCSDAEAFANFVKGITGDVPPESDFACENSSASEIASLSTLQSCAEQPMPTDDGRISDLINNKQLELSYPIVLSSCASSISSGLPPSFAELLTNCLNQTGKEQTNPTSHPGNGSNDKEHLMNPYLQGALVAFSENSSTYEQSNPTDELDFEFHAQEFLVNPLLQGILSKLDKIVDELGGDLALEVADLSREKRCPNRPGSS
ncbi:protein POOR HOMOLOGOUS SYNAPSIS 1-like [Curcuma longa]|uniref:protein POOR HOMOLOGOUS SYNAPSIS 1-like n=1 Tax=Curcuma longa TaxID=136217 RepID=UPI003D9E31AC